MNNKIGRKLITMDACSEAIEWVGDRTFKEAWKVLSTYFTRVAQKKYYDNSGANYCRIFNRKHMRFCY